MSLKRAFITMPKKSSRNKDNRARPRLRNDSRSSRLELSFNKINMATAYSEELHNMFCTCKSKKKCEVYQSYFDDSLKAVDSNSLKKDLVSFYNANLLYEELKSLVQRASVAESIIGYRSGDGRKIMGFHILLNGEKRQCCRACFMKVIEIEEHGLKKLMRNNDEGYIGAGGDVLCVMCYVLCVMCYVLCYVLCVMCYVL